MFLRSNASFIALVVMSSACSAPTAWAQDNSEALSGNDIIVTAQRVEQRLQDVPISVTVFTQEKLTNNNITSAKDLTLYTPGLQTNNRYGSDNTTFTIRGFTQDQRTSSTVGTFFADVVMPRGSGASLGGDGAGPGALFDLQNVQVLKGPQGTLFGRNVTGGAILLVPRKPSDRFEGYVEGSYGSYDMKRLQAVANVPVMDSLRVRVGVDRMKRDGYLTNVGKFGDGINGNVGMGDTDYWAMRFSAAADLTPDLENYTIISYAHSRNNGVIPKITECYPTATLRLGAGNAVPLGAASCDQLANAAKGDFWTVSNRLPNSGSITDTWQAINTTTWMASDTLTIKNIISYGEFRGSTNIDLYGNYMVVGAPFGSETSPGQVTGFAFTNSERVHGYTNAQSSFVEELQFQGTPGEGRFTWQAGVYIELNNPLGYSGVQTAAFTPCADILTFDCLGPTPNQSAGTGSLSLSRTKFRGYAAYGQVNYDLSSKLKLTAGIRYTKDQVRSTVINQTLLFGNPANESTVRIRCTNPTAAQYSGQSTFPFTAADRFIACKQQLSQDSEAPTWLLGLDYTPADDVMVYAKWSRGYRQGGIAIFGPDPIQSYDPEKVDAYEIGAKTSWRGAVPGNFNISGYYNDFRDQQVLMGVQCNSAAPGFTIACPGNAAVLNAGKSRMYGLEAEMGITPIEGLRLEASYAYMNSKLLAINIPPLGSLAPYNEVIAPKIGDVIPNSGPPHKLVASATYTLPLAESVGRISFGATFAHQASYQAVPDSGPLPGRGRLPAQDVVNLNFNWQNVGSLPIDASLFVTNLTNEKLYLHPNDNQARGFVSYLIGEPRMWGGRLRYRFGL